MLGLVVQVGGGSAAGAAPGMTQPALGPHYVLGVVTNAQLMVGREQS